MATNTLLLFFAAFQLLAIGLLADLMVRVTRPSSAVDPASITVLEKPSGESPGSTTRCSRRRRPSLTGPPEPPPRIARCWMTPVRFLAARCCGGRLRHRCGRRRDLDRSSAGAAGRSVVLCESGSVELEAETQALYEGDRSGYPFWSTVEGAHEFGLDEPELRAAGERQTTGTGCAGRSDPIDFEVRDDLPETGWPISRSEPTASTPRPSSCAS